MQALLTVAILLFTSSSSSTTISTFASTSTPYSDRAHSTAPVPSNTTTLDAVFLRRSTTSQTPADSFFDIIHIQLGKMSPSPQLPVVETSMSSDPYLIPLPLNSDAESVKMVLLSAAADFDPPAHPDNIGLRIVATESDNTITWTTMRFKKTQGLDDRKHFRGSPVFKRLGFSIKVFYANIRYDGQPKPDPEKERYDSFGHQLFYEIHPNCPVFGEILEDLPDQEMLIMRADGKNLELAELLPFYGFIEEFVKPSIAAFKEEASAKNRQTMKAVIWHEINPRAFNRYFRKFCSNPPEGLLSKEDWAKAVCPVEDRDSCKSCRAKDCGEGKELMKCGKCVITRYCGRACQEKDWKFHKLICSTLKTKADSQKPKAAQATKKKTTDEKHP